MKETLSVVLIAHNEEQAIGPMLEGLMATYDREILEVIVVDDASTDNTRAIVESWIKRGPKVRLVKRPPPCGVGRALKTGFCFGNRVSARVRNPVSKAETGFHFGGVI